MRVWLTECRKAKHEKEMRAYEEEQRVLAVKMISAESHRKRYSMRAAWKALAKNVRVAR